MADFLNNSLGEDTQPIMDIITQVMSIPEESLNEASMDVISGMILGGLTPNIRTESIKNVVASFENDGLTRSQAKALADASKNEIAEAIKSFKPSPNKQALLDVIFNFFYEIFDAAADQYHNYAIDLPIKLENGGQVPTYAHDTDACADLYAVKDMIIPAHSLSNLVHTGIRIALPENWVFLIDPRSSIGLKSGLRLSNSVGIVDEDYRGEIGILYDNISDSDYEIKAGDRIAQCWVQPVYRFRPQVVDILPATERGEGGFGSSGK